MYSANAISRIFDTTSSANQSVVTKQMLNNAYAWFAQRHPQLMVDMLDKSFLMRDGKPIIDDYAGGAINLQRAALSLAEAREEQLVPMGGAAQKRRRTDLIMAADSFLKLLRTELS